MIEFCWILTDMKLKYEPSHPKLLTLDFKLLIKEQLNKYGNIK